jgi:hypothetical protein
MLAYLELFPLSPRGWTGELIYFPLKIYQQFPAQSLAAILIISIASVLLPLNLISSTILLVISMALVPMAPKLYSGADLVLAVFMGFAWILVLVRDYPRPFLNRITFSELVFFFLKMHVGFIYLESGVDKLFSEAWRSGEALYMATQLPYHVPPHLRIDLPDLAYPVISWMIILFEVGFIVLIWPLKTRKFILFSGVIFELIIFWYFSIPDFALVMLCGYIPFLKAGPPIQDFFKRAA